MCFDPHHESSMMGMFTSQTPICLDSTLLIPALYYWSKAKNNWNHPTTSFHHVDSHPHHNKSKTWLHLLSKREDMLCYTQTQSLQQSDHTMSTENTPIVLHGQPVHQITRFFQSAILPARVQFQHLKLKRTETIMQHHFIADCILALKHLLHK